MRARLVLITALCGAAFLVGACQSDTAGSGRGETPGTSSPRQRISSETARSAVSSGASTTASPSTVRTVFDRATMQTSVLRLLADDYGIRGVQQVSCPPGEEVADGNTFECTAVIDGEARQVRISVTGDEGEYVVARPR